MKNILNVAGYKFLPLGRLEILREELKDLCSKQKLKGTILLSKEGINIMMAGLSTNIANFTKQLIKDSRFTDIDFKTSYSDFIPFKRLLIKIKKEVVTFAVPAIQPHITTAEKISPREFKQWLNENKDIAILDVRNECEIKAGKFKNAINLGIKNFRSFPKASQKLPESLKEKPIIMYCTGGIRCEKAGAYLLQRGFKQIFQLHGGILKYFFECGNAHFDGKCFVFDDRIALQDEDVRLPFGSLSS